MADIRILLEQIKIKLLSEASPERVNQVMADITTLVNQPKGLEPQHLDMIKNAEIHSIVLAEALVELCKALVEKSDDVRTSMMHSPDLPAAAATWVKHKEAIEATIVLIADGEHEVDAQMIRSVVILSILCAGKDAERNWLAIARETDIDNIRALSIGLALFYSHHLFDMPNGAIYYQNMLEQPENMVPLLEGLVKAEQLGILTGDIGLSTKELLLNNMEYAPSITHAIAALCNTPLWQLDVVEETKRNLISHAENLSNTRRILNVAAEAGLFSEHGAQKRLNQLLELSDDFHVSCLMRLANQQGLLRGDGASNNVDKILAVANQSKEVNDLMELAVKTKLLPGHSKQETQALFDQIIQLAETEHFEAISALAFTLRDSAFGESWSYCQSEEDVLQQQTLFLLLLSSSGATAKELNNILKNPRDSTRDIFNSSLRKDYYRSNLITLLRSGHNIKHALEGLYALRSSYLGHPKLDTACRDAMIQAGPNASFVARALSQFKELRINSQSYSWARLIDYTGLIDYTERTNNPLSEAAQKNIGVIVAAGQHAEHVPELLLWAHGLGLLDKKDDDIRKTILQCVDKHQQIIKNLHDLSTLRLINIQSQAFVFTTFLNIEQSHDLVAPLNILFYQMRETLNVNDLKAMLSTGNHAASCCYAVAIAHSIYQPSTEGDPQWRNNERWEKAKETIIQKLKSKNNNVELAPLLTELFVYRQALNEDVLTETLALDEARCRQIHRAFSVLQAGGLSFITPENYRALLKEKNNPELLARVMTGRLNQPELMQISELGTFSGLVKPELIATDEFFRLYQALAATPALFSVNMIQGLLQLSNQDQRWLLALISAVSVEHNTARVMQLLFDMEHGLVAHVISQTYQLHHAYALLDDKQIDIPKPNEWESSMRDDYIKLAKERLGALPESMRVNEAQLDEVEIKIREMLLQAIMDESLVVLSTPGIDLRTKAHHEQRRRFITEHQSELARRSDASLNQHAVGMFTQLDSTAETAWRAYEPLATTVDWPNLLTPSQNESTIFSTAASAQGGVSLRSGSTLIRLAAATFFNAVVDPHLSPEIREALQSKFVYQIAEIRRAHNIIGISGTDSPSCFPGCWSRLGLILDEHPHFIREKPLFTEVVAIVENQLHTLAQETVNSFLAQLTTDSERRLLLSAIRLYSQPFATYVLSDPSAIENNLSVTHDDLTLGSSPEEVDNADLANQRLQKYIERANGVHKAFMKQLWQRIQDSLKDTVAIACAEAHFPQISQQTLDYLVLKHIGNVITLINIPEALIQASMEQIPRTADANEQAETETAEQRFTVTLRNLLATNGDVIPDELMAGLTDRLHVLMMSLTTNATFQCHELGEKIATKLADLSACWLEQGNPLTTQSILNALISTFPDKIISTTPADEGSTTMRRQGGALSQVGLFQAQRPNTPDDKPASVGRAPRPTI